MKNMKTINALLVLLIFGFSSCKKDPYPETGQRRVDPIEEDKEPLPELSMAVDKNINLKEGRNLSYQIRVAVPDEAEAIVWVDNLPKGAQFDEETLILSWKPDYFAGNEPGDPSKKSVIYPITVWLRSSLDTRRALSEEVNLVVHDRPREIKINTNASSNATEGSLYENIFEIENTDYPNGPFKVTTTDMPPNMEVIKINETKFKLQFTPDYFHVNRKTQGSSVSYNGKITIANPANHLETKKITIRVNDKRLKNKLVLPAKKIVQGLDMSFQVAAYDLNKEISPSVVLSSSEPPFGKFEYDLVENKDNYSSVLNVHWNDIPPKFNGTTQRLSFQSCVLNSSGDMRNCEYEELEVEIVVRDRKPPFINRMNWPVGELLYLNFNETFTRNISINDGEDPQLDPEVKVFPESMRKYVSWEDGRIRLKFDKSGVFQFNLVAESDYKVSSAESFIVEVFPEDRYKTLLFADSSRDPEVKFYQETFKSLNVMNPAIQAINERNISGRETLVLTTSTLFDKNTNKEIFEATKKIKNIVVASPLINNLPKELLTKFIEEYDFSIIGRYNELPNMPDLTKMKFMKTSHFEKSKAPIGLKGLASEVSANPLIFNGGLYDTNKNCKGVLGISENENNPYVIGVVCKRRNGGRAVILGTEWADLKVGNEDKQIPYKWFQTMLKANF